MVHANNAAIPAASTTAQLIKSSVLVSQSHWFESRSIANVFKAFFSQLFKSLTVHNCNCHAFIGFIGCCCFTVDISGEYYQEQ